MSGDIPHGIEQPRVEEVVERDRLSERLTEEWRPYLDRLLEWYKDPEQVRDEFIRPPSHGVVRAALSLASRLRSQGLPPPTSIEPDGVGGIVLEREVGSLISALEIAANGNITLAKYDSDKFLMRVELGEVPV